VTVIEQRAAVATAPAKVFAYLHDPARRPEWDAMADLCRLEADAPAAGVRMHLRGRRTAPSWVGEYTAYDPPRRSQVRLVEGVGMPFSAFTQTIAVEGRDGGASVTLRLEYHASGLGRLLEPVVLRPRLSTAVRRSLENIQRWSE
jgi:uncharacterized protein YndB with AHSA1/START domain